MAANKLDSSMLETGIDAGKLTGTHTSFTSTGIDDNADALAITISSAEHVGIGNTTPGARLTIAQSSDDPNGGIRLIGTAGSLEYWDQYVDADEMFHLRNGTNANSLVMSKTGNLGIGTLIPECKAHIMKASSGGTTDGSAVCHMENSGSALLQITAGSTNTAGIAFGDSENSNIGSVYYDNSVNAMTFRADNGEKMRITSAGNVGIGNTYAVDTLTQTGNIRMRTGDTRIIGLANDTNYGINNTGGCAIRFDYDGSNDEIAFETHKTGVRHAETMRISSDGYVGIGYSAPVGQLHLESAINTMNQIYMRKSGQVEAHIGFKSGTDQKFYVGTSGGTTGVGSYGLYQTNTGNSWTSVSDERLKTNLQPITNAREKIAGCRAVTGRFTYDEDESKSRAFLIAQDWVDVLPEAVDQDDPDKLGLSYDATIPLLVASIKELIVEVDNLKQEVATLKGA